MYPSPPLGPADRAAYRDLQRYLFPAPQWVVPQSRELWWLPTRLPRFCLHESLHDNPPWDQQASVSFPLFFQITLLHQGKEEVGHDEMCSIKLLLPCPATVIKMFSVTCPIFLKVMQSEHINAYFHAWNNYSNPLPITLLELAKQLVRNTFSKRIKVWTGKKVPIIYILYIF